MSEEHDNLYALVCIEPGEGIVVIEMPTGLFPLVMQNKEKFLDFLRSCEIMKRFKEIHPEKRFEARQYTHSETLESE